MVGGVGKKFYQTDDSFSASSMKSPRNKQDRTEQIERGLRLCPIFLDWPANRLRELACVSRMQHYGRRTQLLRGSHRREILVIVSGSIEIAATNANGKKYLLSVAGPGQVARLVQLDDMPVLFAYYAHEDSQVIHIPGSAMKQILDAEPALWRSIAQLMMGRFRRSIEVRRGQALGSLRRRIAITLVHMARRYGEEEIVAYSAELRISQTNLASMLGVSRQTINKELGQLKDEGLLGYSDGYRLITLLDVPRLLHIAEEN